MKTDPASVGREPMTVGRERVYVPTLSELIEACGVFTLDIRLDDVVADKPQVGIEVSGGTPEEAVAKLWLALNASPKDSLT
jgi:hypothetical protein